VGGGGGGGGLVGVEVGLGTSVALTVGISADGGIVWVGSGWVGINAVELGVIGGGLNMAVMVRSGVGKTGWGVGLVKKGKLQARAARMSNPATRNNEWRIFIMPPASLGKQHKSERNTAILILDDIYPLSVPGLLQKFDEKPGNLLILPQKRWDNQLPVTSVSSVFSKLNIPVQSSKCCSMEKRTL